MQAGTKKATRALALAGIAAFALSACGTTGGNDSSDNAGSGSSSSGGKCGHYNIAFLGAETGDSAALGLNMVGGIKLALSEYNAKHADCTVGLKDFDSQGDPSKAPPLASEIVSNQSIVGLVGPGFSGESLATGDTFSQAGLTSISASATNVTITQKGWKTWHRVIGNDSAQGAADAKYLADKKVFVIDDGSDYGKGLATVVAQGVANKIGTDEVQTGQTDFSATVTKVKASGANAVFYGGYYPEAGLLVKQLRQAGWNGLFMSGDGSEDPAFVKAAGAQAADGAILTAPAGPAPSDFDADYQKVNGSPSGLYSTQAYDSANVFLAGIDAGKDRSTMNDFVNSYSGTGVSGPIAFDDKGDIKESTIYAYTVKDGKLDTSNPTAINK